MIKKITNASLIGAILLLLYFVVGQGFTEFFLGGKTELLETAGNINKLCNAKGACPATLEGWQLRGGVKDRIFKGNMIYIVSPGEGAKNGGDRKMHQEFRLVYGFFTPDHWFEAQGGVGMKVTSGWKSR